MGLTSQEYFSGLPFPSPGDLLDPEIEPVSPALQADSLPLSHLESHECTWIYFILKHMLCTVPSFVHIVYLFAISSRNVCTFFFFAFIFLSLFPTIAEVISRGMGGGRGEVQLINLLLTIGLKILLILTSSQTLWGYKKDLERKIEIEIY